MGAEDQRRVLLVPQGLGVGKFSMLPKSPNAKELWTPQHFPRAYGDV